MGTRVACVKALVPSLLALSLVTAATAQSLPAPDALARSLDVRAATLQALVLPDTAQAPFTVDLELDGAPARLVLQPHDLRARGFRVLVQGADGALAEVEPAAPATLRGHVQGRPGSRVAASLLADGLHAWVRLAPGQAPWGVQPAGGGRHVVYDAADAGGEPWECGTQDADARPAAPAAAPGDTPAPDVVCEIACDADFEFYQLNGSSVSATQADVELVLNGVDAIYTHDVDVQYAIGTIIVRTAEPDPYSSASPGTLLNQFSSHWNSQQQGVKRDIAHLFTGKDLDGSVIGIAQLSVICSQSSGYGLSQSRYSLNLTNRVALTAHELGHNWSANHCDGEPDCSIMCSGLGGCSGNLTSFNASSVNAINAEKNSSSCLSPAVPPPPPVITSVWPQAVEVFPPPTLTVTGSSFEFADGLLLGDVQLHKGSGYLVLDDATISMTPPEPAALGPVQVVVSNPSGTSNAGSFTWIETSPPNLQASAVTFTGFTMSWSFFAGAGDPAFLLLGLGPETFTYQGQDVLAFDLILWSGALDPIGQGSLDLVIPASALGLVFWSQLATLDGATLATSAIPSTWVAF
jgi:hypothetical protein